MKEKIDLLTKGRQVELGGGGMGALTLQEPRKGKEKIAKRDEERKEGGGEDDSN